MPINQSQYLSNPTLETLKSFLCDDTVRYYIPKYQRVYSWKSNMIQSFWDDLIMTDNSELKFSGSVIIKHKHGDDNENIENPPCVGSA